MEHMKQSFLDTKNRQLGLCYLREKKQCKPYDVPSFLPGGKLWTVVHEWDPKQNIFKSHWVMETQVRIQGNRQLEVGGEDATQKKRKKEKKPLKIK